VVMMLEEKNNLEECGASTNGDGDTRGGNKRGS
jgi:hypothetical protein